MTRIHAQRSCQIHRKKNFMFYPLKLHLRSSRNLPSCLSPLFPVNPVPLPQEEWKFLFLSKSIIFSELSHISNPLYSPSVNPSLTPKLTFPRQVYTPLSATVFFHFLPFQKEKNFFSCHGHRFSFVYPFCISTQRSWCLKSEWSTVCVIAGSALMNTSLEVRAKHQQGKVGAVETKTQWLSLLWLSNRY